MGSLSLLALSVVVATGFSLSALDHAHQALDQVTAGPVARAALYTNIVSAANERTSAVRKVARTQLVADMAAATVACSAEQALLTTLTSALGSDPATTPAEKALATNLVTIDSAQIALTQNVIDDAIVTTHPQDVATVDATENENLVALIHAANAANAAGAAGIRAQADAANERLRLDLALLFAALALGALAFIVVGVVFERVFISRLLKATTLASEMKAVVDRLAVRGEGKLSVSAREVRP
jgi:hypothetical protein